VSAFPSHRACVAIRFAFSTENLHELILFSTENLTGFYLSMAISLNEKM